MQRQLYSYREKKPKTANISETAAAVPVLASVCRIFKVLHTSSTPGKTKGLLLFSSSSQMSANKNFQLLVAVLHAGKKSVPISDSQRKRETRSESDLKCDDYWE